MKAFFTSLTAAIQAFSPALFSFVETTLPYTTPTPIAIITSNSAATYFGLTGLGAFLFVYSLEAIGLIATSKLVETIVDFIKGRNIKTLIMIVVLALAVYAYITILVSINVKIHTEITDPGFSQALTLICYLPLIAGILNGLSLVKLEYVSNVVEQKSLAEQHYQQSREDRLKLKMLKYQVNVPAVDQQVKTHKQKMAGDYKEYVFELLDQYGDMPLTEITKAVNKNKRVEFVHADVKGTWYKYVQQWKQGKQQ